MKKKSKKQRETSVIYGAAILAVLIIAAMTALLVTHCSRKDEEPEASSESSMEESQEQRTIPESSHEEPTSGTEGEGFLVCLDAGHGGDDPGAKGGGYTEAEDTLAMTLLVAKCLEAHGCKVLLTREDDTYISLEDRVYMANQAGANALVSIHRNAVDEAFVNGAEVWIHSAMPSNAVILGTCILNQLEHSDTFDTSRGLRSGVAGNPAANYWINRASNMASVIVELGFITNDEDNEIYHNQMETIAQAICDGILDALEDENFS